MYPLLFEPILLSKVWGGDRLGKFGKAVEPGAKIGESWELADLAATSSGGAGGGAFRSRIINGPLRGKTIHDALEAWRDGLIDAAHRSLTGGYPLLVKYLDASENLSVQVHPSPAYASAHPDAHIKSECWCILDAAPGSVLYKGLKPGITRQSFEQAIRENKVVDSLVAVPAIRGECHALPSGTCHALGAGIVVLEVQTASDTTFRVYDWGRTGRELHIAQSLDCIDFDNQPPPPVRFKNDAPLGGELITPDFKLTQRRIGPEGFSLDQCPGPFMVIAGSGRLEIPNADQPPLRVATGATGLIPAKPDCFPTLISDPQNPLTCIFASLRTPVRKLP